MHSEKETPGRKDPSTGADLCRTRPSPRQTYSQATVINLTRCCEISDFCLNVVETFSQANIVPYPKKVIQNEKHRSQQDAEGLCVIVTNLGRPTGPFNGDQRITSGHKWTAYGQFPLQTVTEGLCVPRGARHGEKRKRPRVSAQRGSMLFSCCVLGPSNVPL